MVSGKNGQSGMAALSRAVMAHRQEIEHVWVHFLVAKNVKVHMMIQEPATLSIVQVIYLRSQSMEV